MRINKIRKYNNGIYNCVHYSEYVLAGIIVFKTPGNDMEQDEDGIEQNNGKQVKPGRKKYNLSDTLQGEIWKVIVIKYIEIYLAELKKQQ